jgi:DnaJ-class molecular chaperone
MTEFKRTKKVTMPCKSCNGKGEVMDTVPGGWGFIPVVSLCEECLGLKEREYDVEVEDEVSDYTQSIITNRNPFNR